MQNFLKFFNKIIWTLVLLIVLAYIGRSLLKEEKLTEIIHYLQPKKTKVVVLEKKELDKNISSDIYLAIEKAKKYANNILDSEMSRWESELIERVDNNFLPWYFSYWNQQIIGLKSLGYAALSRIDSSRPSAEEKLIEETQEEFSNRVLRPEIADIELEHIAKNYAESYFKSIKENINVVKIKYNLSEQDWNDYIERSAKTTNNVEANRNIPIMLKTIYGGTFAGGIAAMPFLKTAIAKVTAKISSKVGTKAAAKIAAKTGAKMTGKIAGKFLGPIIGVGILVWDIMDHSSTKKEQLPILRANLLDLIHEMGESIKNDTDNGLTKIIDEINSGIYSQ